VGVTLELNPFPDRLDFNDIQLMMTLEKGVKVVINSDAHRVEELGFKCYGIDQARRT
jgi:DNA polymerase (family 10)